jgi:hypothetical protein
MGGIVLLGVTASCASIIGADFSGYTAYCDPIQSTGCSSNQQCDLSTSAAPKCASLGSGAVGDQCGLSTTPACAKGLICSGHSDSGYYCTKYCYVTPSKSGQCPLAGDGTTAPDCIGFSPSLMVGDTEYGSCPDHDCDPFDPTSSNNGFHPCESGTECHFINGHQIDCRTAGTYSEGATCDYSFDCGSDLFCIYYKQSNGTTQGYCKVPCRTGSQGSSDCSKAGKTTCSALGTPFILDGVQYGTCS